ncbi:hypothetical protein B484DRAFT_181355 [Ochromonadaceae sp. CCMP2298]|nr:hypothetical protein B484DRAFT_181355 [Ochromonadaceae sp. CCMP2298]
MGVVRVWVILSCDLNPCGQALLVFGGTWQASESQEAGKGLVKKVGKDGRLYLVKKLAELLSTPLLVKGLKPLLHDAITGYWTMPVLDDASFKLLKGWQFQAVSSLGQLCRGFGTSRLIRTTNPSEEEVEVEITIRPTCPPFASLPSPPPSPPSPACSYSSA